ncbi:MAG: DUF6049 family protein, partial [Candidatus Nanopelagicales bacterium]
AAGLRVDHGRTVSPPAADRPAIGAGVLSIRISSVTPTIPEEEDTVLLRGSITNSSTTAVTGVVAAMRISPTPLAGRSEIPGVVSGSSNRFGTRVEGARQDVAGTLEPGSSAEFSLRAEIADLGLTEVGAYVIGAEVLGNSGAGVQRQDLDRTFLPWWPKGANAEPLLLTMLWPVAGRPVRDAEGVLPDEELAVDMSPTGRLAVLVDAGSRGKDALNWVLDPEVAEAADAMSDGYLVRGDDGSTGEGARQKEVAGWLAQLTAALGDSSANSTAGLYATPDLVAASRDELVNTILKQRRDINSRTAQTIGMALPSRTVLMPGGNADDTTLADLAEGGVRSVVLDDWAMPTRPPVTFTPSGNVVLDTSEGELKVLLNDSALSDALAMPMSSQPEVSAARQRLLAETLVTVGELPSSQRLVVAVPATDWAPSQAAARMVVDFVSATPWIAPTSMADALAREPSSIGRAHVAYDAEVSGPELPRAHVASVEDQFSDLATYGSVTTRPSDVPVSAALAPTRQLGSYFRDRKSARRELQRAATKQIGALIDSVSVVSSGSITVSGSSGTIPITVENSGPSSVTVGLSFSSVPPQVFTAAPVEPFDVAPERRTSVAVSAEVTGGGQIPVAIQLVTTDGTPYGEPVQLVVQSSAYANATRILVRVALALLVLAVLVHGIRRLRRARRANR